MTSEGSADRERLVADIRDLLDRLDEDDETADQPRWYQ